MAEFSEFPEAQSGTSSVHFQSNGWKVNSKTYSWSPPTDVYEANKNLIIKIEIAGMKGSEIFIKIDDNSLVVSGTRKEIVERRAYLQMEIRFGDFNTAINLPDGLDLEIATANYDDGFLTISIPFIHATTIPIKG